MILSIVLLSLAAFFKAVADTLYHHYPVSIFKKLNPKFWNPAISCNYAKFFPFTKYRVDAWHLANSGMIVSFIIFAIRHNPAIAWYWEVLIAGAVFNLVFNLFYDKVLR